MYYIVPILALQLPCLLSVSVMWLLLTMPWVSLQCVIVVFFDYAHLRFKGIPFVVLMNFSLSSITVNGRRTSALP